MGLEAVSSSAIYGLDYSVSSDDVMLLSHEAVKRVPIEIIDDSLPELEEEFIVRLLPPITGGATLGQVTECTVTITQSDDPYGAFGIYDNELLTVYMLATEQR